MYLHWNKKTIGDASEARVDALYNEGYVFTRVGKGVMHQTRSVRVNLSKFELSSENRRILKKTEGLELKAVPLPYSEYHWSIGKMAKDFYEAKFGGKIFSANKVKEILTDSAKSNFNILFTFVIPSRAEESLSPIGYAICHETKEMLHYSYPFYELGTLNYELKDAGMSMMLRAILWAKENEKKYVYLGSAQRPSDTYKMQFAGVEWFDGKVWKNDIEELKILLHQNSNVKHQN